MYKFTKSGAIHTNTLRCTTHYLRAMAKGSCDDYSDERDVAHTKRAPTEYLDDGDDTYADGLPLPATEKGGVKDKKKNKQLSDRLKLNMANERTFTKWLMTGMQMGAIGTFVLMQIDRHNDTIWGVATLTFAWVVGFLIAMYGCYGYYGRRRALQSGKIESDPAIGRALVPAVIMIGLILVVVAGLAYLGTHNNSSHEQATAPAKSVHTTVSVFHR